MVGMLVALKAGQLVDATVVRKVDLRVRQMVVKKAASKDAMMAEQMVA